MADAFVAMLDPADVSDDPGTEGTPLRGVHVTIRDDRDLFAKLMRRIVLPQAFRVIVPPLGNEFNVMLKNTTLVSVIGVQELLLSTQMVTSATFRVFELYLVVAIYFLLLTTLWGFFQRWLEGRFGQSDRPSSPPPASTRMFGRSTLNLLRAR